MLKPTRARAAADRNARFRFAIVASEYNARFVQGLVDAATKEIRAAMPKATVLLQRVPGAFEIPLLVQKAARSVRGVDAVIAFGVILQGKTAHADLIAGSVTDALIRIALETGVPVVHGVLHGTVAQARVRCLQPRSNRGVEAARTAMHMAQIVRDARGRKA
jgi:6,7-dimethyl-8-ribityllumazine synthase